MLTAGTAPMRCFWLPMGELGWGNDMDDERNMTDGECEAITALAMTLGLTVRLDAPLPRRAVEELATKLALQLRWEAT
jgi:hypothetical protein